MTLKEFINSLSGNEPPQQLTGLLLALWFDGKGNWEKAHELAQDVATSDGAWVHAFLHRKEGDISNATYWYHQAGKKLPNETLEDEWKSISTHMLAHR